ELDVVGSLYLLGAALIGSGVRWGPGVGAVITGGAFFYAIFLNPYPAYHFAHAQDAFPLFLGVLLGVVSMALATVANVTAVLGNYRGAGAQGMPRWMYSVFLGGVCFIGGAAIFAGIAQPPASSAATAGVPTVHLRLSDFSPAQITLPAGAQLHFAADGAVPHVLDYGQWNGKHADTRPSPAGLPTLNDLPVNGASFTIGPFTTPGTYTILCIVHPGMELTIIVTG
nr:hypothetical protein [Ktedonobacterales bacterium]